MALIFGFDVVRQPVEDCFGYAADHGLDHLEIDLIRESSFIETFDAERISNLRTLAENFDISLSLHTPFSVNLSDKIPTIRDATISYLRRCVAVAFELNATHITTHVGYCLGVKPSKRKALNRLVDNLQQVLHDCQEFSMKLAIENVNPMPDGSELFYLADSLEECEFLLTELDSPYVNLCLDIGHAKINEGPLAYIEKFGKKIINVHFHDNNGKTDDHLDVGKGTIAWKKVVDALRAINFCGPFVSECFNSIPHEAKNALLKYF